MIKPLNATMTDTPAPKVNAVANAALLSAQYQDLLKTATDRIEVIKGEAQYLEAELKKRQEEFNKLQNQATLAQQSLQTIEFILNNAATAAAEQVEAEAPTEPLAEPVTEAVLEPYVDPTSDCEPEAPAPEPEDDASKSTKSKK